MGYPTVDRGGVDRLLGDERALAAVTLMVDDPAHLALVDAVRAGRDATVRVAIDIDAGLRMGALARRAEALAAATTPARWSPSPAGSSGAPGSRWSG